MSRRADGEGSISKASGGRDLWRYRWTEMVDGKPVRRVKYAKTREAAADELLQIRSRIKAGQPGLDSDSPFREVAERWRRIAPISQGVGTRSMGTYVGVLKLHVYPIIGDVPIGEVRASHVAEVLAVMAGKGLSKAYQHQAHKVISNVFKMALADDLVIRNPTSSVKAPRGGHKPKVVPSRGQVLAMLEQAPDARMRAFVAVLAYTGLRIGEALALRWSDWDADTLRVMTSKGSGRTRAIPVPAGLKTELEVWRKAQTSERLASVWWDDDHDWILSTNVGTQWDPHNARRRFRTIVEDRLDSDGETIPGVCPGATPHSLRHATATLLLEEGVPMRVVAELLGHSSTRITEDTYSHVTARLITEAGDAIGRALG